MQISGRVIDGHIKAAPRSWAVFKEKAEGKDIIITIDDEASANKRKFFEGAIVPAVFYQNPHSGWENFKECREALKLEFLPGWTKDFEGQRIKYARSTTELSNDKFGELIQDVIRWMQEQAMEIPDPEEYKDWRDSAPPPGEVYPQLQRLKDNYEAAH